MKENLLEKKEIAAADSKTKRAHKPHKNFHGVRRYVFIYGGLAWAVLHFCVFWAYVNAGTLVNSFFGQRLDGSMVWEGLYYYRQVFEYVFGGKVNGMVSLRSCLNTLSMVGLALLINLPLTLLFSYMIFKKVRFHSILRVGMYLPCVVSLVIMSLFYATFCFGRGEQRPAVFDFGEHGSRQRYGAKRTLDKYRYGMVGGNHIQYLDGGERKYHIFQFVHGASA